MSKNTEKEKRNNQIKKLNGLFRTTSSQISNNIYGTNNSNQDEIDRLNFEVEKIINLELSDTKSITSDEMSVFLVKLFNEFDKTSGGEIKNLGDIFESDTTGIFQFFQERYRNQNLLYDDLHMITDQLFEMEEAINTTRDAIVTADDFSKTVSRTLRFNHIDPEVNDDYDSYIRTIEELERKNKLLTKLKNQIIPNTLTYGNYFVYVCPYSKLFQEQYDKKVEKDYDIKKVSESVDESFVRELRGNLTEMYHDKKLNLSESTTSTITKIKEYTDNIGIINDCISIPLVEGVDLTELVDNDKFKKKTEDIIKDTIKTADGTYDTSKRKNKNGIFSDELGCYIKYIDPRKMIPVSILDTVIGYYYIHGSDFQVNKSPFSTTIKVTTNGVSQSTEDVEMMFISKITDKIVKAFDKPFLEKNAKFKDLVLNSLLYNDLYKRDLKFQFIPAEYVVEFKVNEDENGNGRSVLAKALFYAKLYLALLIFKMISIITKSNDTRICYVKNSGIDQNITNKVQEVARSIKSRQINFMDLLNYNSIISKIGSYKEIFIPVGRSGERGIEFDTLAGQDVPMNTDLMEMLRTNMINGTGVPSVIMNYINEADYAKTLVMANSKFLGRVVSYQLDLNTPTTEMYKLIIKHSNISIPENILEDFEFVFNTPKTLNNMNMTDMIANTDQIIMAAIKAVTGENADQTDLNNKIKDKIYNTLFRQYMPMLDWGSIDDAYKNAKLELEEKEAEDKANTDKNKEENGY